MLLGIFGQITGGGGIERMSRHAGAVIADLAREHQASYSLCTLNDAPGRHSVETNGVHTDFQGYGQSKRTLIAAVARALPHTSVAFLGHPSFSPLVLFSKLLNPMTRFHVAVHGVEVWEPLKLLELWGMRACWRVLATTEYTKEAMVTRHGISRNRAVVVPPALDPDFVVHGVYASGSNSQFTMLTVSRMVASEKLKGVDTIIHALPAMAAAIPNLRLIIAGDGDDRPRLEALARRLDVSPIVRFAGRVSDAELCSLYRDCDVFVMPSAQEGFGIVFLEAMAFRKPAIGGNHGGTTDLIADGVDGFLVNYGDLDTLVDRVIRLARDPALRHRMGAAGRTKVENNYTFDHYRQRLRSVLEPALAAIPSRARSARESRNLA